MQDHRPPIAQLDETSPTDSYTSWGRELLATLLPAIAAVLVINLFLAQPRVVHGQSMEPNLHENQRVIADLVTYRLREPQRQEIVLFWVPDRSPGPPLIKRAIGLPGDIVGIRDGFVYVNGEELNEPYLDQKTPGRMLPTQVPEAHMFVLGDNRCCSNDSRYFGMVPLENILGRAWVRYWPPSEVSLFK